MQSFWGEGGPQTAAIMKYLCFNDEVALILKWSKMAVEVSKLGCYPATKQKRWKNFGQDLYFLIPLSTVS